jgi:hypothetical protein
LTAPTFAWWSTNTVASGSACTFRASGY